MHQLIIPFVQWLTPISTDLIQGYIGKGSTANLQNSVEAPCNMHYEGI